MSGKKILYGVCGIGNGHTQRQLPLIEHFAGRHTIVIFAYDSSYAFYANHFDNHPSVTVVEVAVPFYVGSKDGIDFEATEQLPRNQKDFAGINAKAKAMAKELIGTPDLVISDYEPICAEYAYEHGAPLITIDQQSKYLAGDFPQELHGLTYADEVARLKLFFPTAACRIACSFFDVRKKEGGDDVLMLPSILSDSVVTMKNVPSEPREFLVYFSSQQVFPQSLEEVVQLCETEGAIFHIFAPDIAGRQGNEMVHLYSHGAPQFKEILARCSGIISTAGHTLLSEAMSLGIPVYALPLPLYEQQMNAEVIQANGFGISANRIDGENLRQFVSSVGQYREAIRADRDILLRGNGKTLVVEHIERFYL
ncbi:MAG TPA: glycosyltransferase family protein [Verrucomicrobiae bacterium]|nr:glycosyltransferase family protein [Verrucomicrobiae bacterium]